jgi:hypothetical protein
MLIKNIYLGSRLLSFRLIVPFETIPVKLLSQNGQLESRFRKIALFAFEIKEVCKVAFYLLYV